MDITEDAILTVTEGLPDYERYTYAIHNVVLFNGKTLNQWQEEVVVPQFSGLSSLQEQDMLNHAYIERCEVVMSNLARAKSAKGYANMHYKSTIIKEKDRIVAEYARTNRKLPSNERVEDLAKIRHMDGYIASHLADTFYEFWEVLYQKINMINFRLTGMNTMKNIESRLST